MKDSSQPPREKILELLKKSGALLKGHFILTSGRHASEYINKDAIYCHPEIISEISKEIFLHFLGKDIEVIAGPAIGGAILAHWMGSWYRSLSYQPLIVFAEEDQEKERKFKRGYDQLIKGKKVLIVEDVLTTGSSVKKTVREVRRLNGEIIGVGAIVNRGGVNAKKCGDVPELFTLADINMVTWSPAECPLCKEGVPVSTKFGKGGKN